MCTSTLSINLPFSFLNFLLFCSLFFILLGCTTPQNGQIWTLHLCAMWGVQDESHLPRHLLRRLTLPISISPREPLSGARALPPGWDPEVWHPAQPGPVHPLRLGRAHTAGEAVPAGEGDAWEHTVWPEQIWVPGEAVLRELFLHLCEGHFPFWRQVSLSAALRCSLWLENELSQGIV